MHERDPPMTLLLLHPGDLDLSQWVFIFIIWVVIPLVILYGFVNYLYNRNKNRK